MINDLVLSLAQEYLATIASIEGGLFSDHAELRNLESNRSVFHSQLETALSKRIDKHAMPDYARRILRGEA
jgi:hypothetical protein